jgi:homoserine dehydrogenase
MDVRLVLSGFGNVGQGLATLLDRHGQEYQRRYGVRLLLSGVADRGGGAADPNGLDLQALLEAKRRHGTMARVPEGAANLRGAQLLDRAEAQVLVEAASTNFETGEPGWTYVRESLSRNMDLVLASKGALILHYQQLMEEAQRLGRQVLFSATVGAPLPILQIAERALLGVSVEGFEGILNATTNHILTAMSDGASYDEGVRMAQEIGIAETDPTLDVDGWDAAAKAAIVANAVLGGNVGVNDVEREGIRTITQADLQDARLQGETIKLIARASRESGRVRAQVRPERRPLADPLGRLRGDEMGVVLHAHPLGRFVATVRVESGGGVATAYTVLRDVLNLSRDRGWGKPAPG